MVERNIIEPEVIEALNYIDNGENFILTGGAGSGKTHSLISLIAEISIKYPNKSIICITYTNNAVAEIRDRISNNRLIVSTIHEFLWEVIKRFQAEIKETLVEIINSDNRLFKKPENVNQIDVGFFGEHKVRYDEYYRIKNDNDSTISHDHVLILAEKMFEKYKRLCDIFKDTAHFIFIDEYQDTDPIVVKILLEHINKSDKECVVGFFGDSMQSIYDQGVGNIDNNELNRIEKIENRRNPQAVIELGNKLRNDNIEQRPSDDKGAPNREDGKVKQGKITFLYRTISGENHEPFQELENAKASKNLFVNWDFQNPETTRELWLTHSFNAEKSEFGILYNLYHRDPIKELIDKMKGIDESEIVSNLTFKDLAEEHLDVFDNRRRGNLYKNACEEYEEKLNVIINKPWKEVKEYTLNKDSLLSYKFNGLTNTYKAESSRDPILRQLDDLYEVIELYRKNNIIQFLKRCPYKINSISDKNNLTDVINKLEEKMLNKENIENILDFAFDNNLISVRDNFKNFISERGFYLWERIKLICYQEYIKSIEYQKTYLPFSTQHSVKGSEYDNVLVVLDNGGWNKYNFHKMFTKEARETVQNRTEKLFYVCVTRAMENLVVYMELNDSNKQLILDEVKVLFGQDNVRNIEDLN